MSRPSISDSAYVFATPQAMVMVAALFLGAVSAMAGEQPTALWWWNPILAALFSFVVCLAGSRSRRGPILSACAVAVVATGTQGLTLWTVIALFALGLAYGAEASDRDFRPLLRSAAMGLSMIALYRIPPLLTFGIPSLIAGCAVLPVLISGWRNAPEARRRWSRWPKHIAAGIVALTLVTAVAAALFAGPVPSTGRRAVSQAREGNLAEAASALSDAASSTKRVSWALNGPWAWPARLVPIVSQHLDLAGAAADVAYTGTSAANKVITQVGNGSIQTSTGAIQLGTIESLSPEVLRATDALEELDDAITSDTTNWLVPPIRGQVEAVRPNVDEAIVAAESIEALIGHLPRLLGSEEPMRYFVIFGTPAESRELGGLLGAYAVIEFDNGAMSLVEAGSNTELIDHVYANGKTLADPDQYSLWYQKVNVAKFPQNLTSSPMLQEVASAVRELASPIAGGDIDAVVYLDPVAVQALVAMLGSIEVAGIPEPLTGANTADYLLVEQYKLFDDKNARKDFLVALLEGMFAEIQTTDLVALAPKLRDLGPMIDEKRIQIATYDDELNQALQKVHLLQQYPNPNLGTDFLAVSSHNIGPNKLDTWLQRDVSYDIELDPNSGDLAGTVTIGLTNGAPSGLPDYMLGTDYTIGLDVARNPDIERNPAANRTIISIYTPHELVRSESLTNPETEFVSWNEFGYERHTASLEVQPGQTATITFELKGTIQPGDYQLYLASQPLVNADTVQLTANGTNGWKLGDGAASFDFVQSHDMQFVIPAEWG